METTEPQNGTTQEQASKHHEREHNVDDYMVNATKILRSWLDAFSRTASLTGFPSQVPQGFLMLFPMALQIVNLEMHSMFHASVLELLHEMVERTRADGGGLDPKAIQDEMERRRFAVAMGPDVEILQRLVTEQNAVQAQQGREIAKLRGQLKDVMDTLSAVKGDETRSNLREQVVDLIARLSPGKKKEAVGVGEGL